jgi:hypothetical protein
MKNSEDPVRKVPNIAGQGASSNPKRNWRQVPNQAKQDVGRAEVGPGRPTQPISGLSRHPFDLTAIRTIYTPEAKSHASIHLSSAAEQKRERYQLVEERVELVD